MFGFLQVITFFIFLSLTGCPYASRPFTVSFPIQILQRNKPKRRAVDAITQATSVFRPVRENMPKVRIANAAANFGAEHAVRSIRAFLNRSRINGLAETGPSAAGGKLVSGQKKRFARRDIHIQAGAKHTVVYVLIRRFRSGVLCHLKLEGR